MNKTSGTECLVSAMRLAKSVTHLRPYNVRFLNCATVDVESKKLKVNCVLKFQNLVVTCFMGK